MNSHSRIEQGLNAPGQDVGPPPTRKIGLPRNWIATLGLVILAALAAGFGLYRLEASGIREEKINDLKSIAELKVGQITQWRKERLGDAHVVSSSPFFRSSVARWLTRPEYAASRADILGRMESVWKSYGFEDAILAGLDGRLLLSVGSAPPPSDEYSKNLITQAVSSRDIVFGDFHRNPSDNRVYLDVVAPILDPAGRAVAVMILRTDPEQYLYPLIQSWPTSSRSAETLLVRKEGGQVLFLNKIRHRPDPALTMTEPLTNSVVPAVQAVLGREGHFEGRDYRGVKVVAYLQAIPQTPWFMVSKVDRGEIFAEVRYHGFVILGFLTLFIFLTVVLAEFAFNHRQRNLYAALYESEKERRADEEISRVTLYSIGDGVISTDNEGRVRQMNSVAETLTGWTEDEALGKSIGEVFRIVNEETRAEVENPIVRVLREGVIVGLANHTLLIAKDGVERPIADAGAPIRNEQGETSGVVLVFRDRTAERQAEKALTEQKALVEAILDQAVDGIMVCDTRGQVMLINKAAREANGLAPGDPVDGNNLLTIYDSDGRPLPNEGLLLYRALRGETVTGVERHFVRPNGRSIWALSSAAPIQNERGEVIAAVSTHTNINARKRAEEAQALRHSVTAGLAAADTVAEAAPRLLEHITQYLGWMGGDLWLVDAATQRLRRVGFWQAPGAGLDEVTAQGASLTLARGEGFPGRVWATGEPVWAPDLAAEPEFPRKAAVLKAGLKSAFAFPIRLGSDILGVVSVAGAETREPDAFLLQFANEIGSLIGQFIQRKKAEELLRYHAGLVENMSEAAMSTDADFNIVSWNPAAERMYGWQIEEVLGKPSISYLKTEFFEESTRDDAIRQLREQGFWQGEVIQRKKDGSPIYVFSSTSTLKDNAGQDSGFIAVNRDITERKQVEAALRQVREDLDRAQAVGQIGSWRLDVRLNVLTWSDENHRIFGVPEGTPMTYETFLGSVHPDDRQYVDDKWQAGLRGEPYDIEHRIVADGQVKWVREKAYLEFDAAGGLLAGFGITQDITDRKRAEEELRRHRNELEALVKERSEQLYVSEQRLARESAAVTEIVAEMLSGRLTDEETEKQVLNACLEATGSVYGMIGRINESGQWDTTAYSSRALNDCAFPEALAGELSTGMEVRGIWGWPLLHGQPLVCNDLAHHPDRVGLPEGHVPMESYLGVPAKNEGRITGMVAVANRPGGYTEADVGTLTRLVDVMVVARRYRVMLAEARATSAELERRVRERTAQLETANREMEAFSYSVSHDLRAPLRSLDGFSGALLSQYSEKLDEQARHYLERIQAASRRMGQLIDDLLGLSRVSRYELTLRPVDLSAMARQIALGLQAQDPERQAEFVITEGMICQGDTRLLRVALENLMNNAWKFTGGRSPARIEVGADEREGERVYFVRDNGVGFDMTYADKLFSPFQRLHAMHEFPGTGIGLVTVQRILYRHGGRIWPEAAVDQGATFYFTLSDVLGSRTAATKERDDRS